MEPGQELRELEQAILRQDAALEAPPVAESRLDADEVGRFDSRGTVTFLFTDIESSTQLLKTLGRARYGEMLSEHGTLLRAAFSEFNGEVIDSQGDAFFVAFGSAGDAVSAAAAAQRALQRHQWAEGFSLSVRMGLHTGEAALRDDRYLGMAVHLAARIGSAANGGQVLLSEVTRVLVEDELPADVELLDLGEQRLKDIDRPVRVFQLGVAGLPAEFPPLRTGETAFPGREDELAAEAGLALRRERRKRLLLVGAIVLVLAAAIAGTLAAITGGSGLSSIGPTSLGVIDPAKNKLVKEVQLGFKSSYIAAGEGHVWVADPGGSTLVEIDPRTKHVRRLGVQAEGIPIGLAVGHGAVWLAVLRGTRKFVLELEPKYGGVLREIPVGGRLARGDDAIWVTDGDSGSLWRIDPEHGHHSKLAEGLSASSVAITPEAAWVAGLSGLTKIDVVTSEELDEIEPGSPPGEVGSVAAGLGAVWFTSSASRTLWRIDPQTDAVTRTFTTGKGPSALTVGEGAVWSANSRDGSVTRVDRRGNVDTIRIGSTPAGIVAAYGKVWVTSGDPRA
jgi:class 3 adenylate cyclase/streptogramin lyase